MQVWSPSWQLSVKTGTSPRRFMDLEPYRVEQREQEKEYLRNAENFVSVDPEAAALVVYGNGGMQGESMTVSVGYWSSAQMHLKDNTLYASILPRQVERHTFYVAIFPRIYFFTTDGEKADISHATGQLKRPNRRAGYCAQKEQEVTLYPGLITEVDWTKLPLR